MQAGGFDSVVHIEVAKLYHANVAMCRGAEEPAGPVDHAGPCSQWRPIGVLIHCDCDSSEGFEDMEAFMFTEVLVYLEVL